MTTTEPGLYKVTVNLIPRAYDALERTAELTGLDRTVCINRALQIAELVEQSFAAGQRVFVRDEGRKGWQREREILIEEPTGD